MQMNCFIILRREINTRVQFNKIAHDVDVHNGIFVSEKRDFSTESSSYVFNDQLRRHAFLGIYVNL